MLNSQVSPPHPVAIYALTTLQWEAYYGTTTYLPTYLLPTTMGRLLPTGKNPAKPQQVAAELPLLTHSLVLTVRGLQADSE